MRYAAFLGIGSLVLAAVACGSDDDDGPTSSSGGASSSSSGGASSSSGGASSSSGVAGPVGAAEACVAVCKKQKDLQCEPLDCEPKCQIYGQGGAECEAAGLALANCQFNATNLCVDPCPTESGAARDACFGGM